MKEIDFMGLAALAAARLEEELTRDSCDTKKAKDYSAVLKENMNLHREFDSYEEREIRIVFDDQVAEAAK